MRVTIQFSLFALFHKFSSCLNLKTNLFPISHRTMKHQHALWFQMTQFSKRFSIRPSPKGALQVEIVSQVFKLRIASSLNMRYFDTM